MKELFVEVMLSSVVLTWSRYRQAVIPTRWGIEHLYTGYKRALSLLLLCCMLASLLPTGALAASTNTNAAEGSSSPITWHEAPQNEGAAPNAFRDVTPADWFYNAVQYVRQNGIFSGTGNDSFSPAGTMTRAMYVTVLGRMAGVDVSQYTTSAFTDVPTDAWYAPYVQWAVEKGITSGIGNRKFSPDVAISREQMATLTLRFFEAENIAYRTDDAVTTKPNDIADISPWAVDAIVKLWQAGLLSGDANGNFNPRAKATRAEAAAFCMRSNEVAKTAANPNPAGPASTPTPIDQNAGSGGNNPGNGNGNGSSATYTVTFESNGGSAVNSLTLRQGESLSRLPVPIKSGFIFQGWYKDSDLTQIVMNGDPVNGNMTLYAKYIGSVNEAVQSIPSITVLDQAPSFTVGVNAAAAGMTANQAKAGMTFESPANPQFAGIQVTGSDGHFTVAAKDGAFEEGYTYRLTLTDSRLSFAGQDQTTTVYIFSIAKQEVVNVPLNADMIYLSFADVSNMTQNGESVDSASIPVMRASVSGSGSTLSSADVTNGTFEYGGGTSIEVGDTVSIYEGIRPDQRTADTGDADNGDVAYVRIVAINGDTYAYTSADSDNVLARPNVLPVSASADTDGDAANGSITVDHSTMNYQDSKYAPLHLNDLTVVKAGDFIAFYNGEFGSQSTSAGYGRITSIAHSGEMDVIAYTDATPEQITDALDFYKKQKIDGDQLLSDTDIASLNAQIKQQAVSSGFVRETADYLSSVALQTDSFKQHYEVNALSVGGDSGIDVSVQNLTVVPSISGNLQHFPGYTGVSVTLQVACDIVIDTDEDNADSIIIHLTSTFAEELRFDLGVNGDTNIHWYWFIPIIEDYTITANLDAYTYTGITVTAEIGTIDKDIADAADWDEARDVENIAEELQALLDGVGDTGAVNAQTLKSKYQSLLENDTEWVPLVSKELLKKDLRVCLGIVQIEFTVNFVISLNPNLAVGCDFGYKSAKRYSVTVRVFGRTGSSNTVSLSGDGEYHFKLYVLGTLGLRAGIQLELKAGLLSVDLDSVGFEVEAGPYLKLWGYFYYELMNSAAAGRQTKSLGAMYLEIGIYLDSVFSAQLGNGALSAEVPLYENEWPLYSVGSQDDVEDFAYPQEDTLGIRFVNSVKAAQLPEKFFTMNVMDLKTGETREQAFNPSNFNIEITNPDFAYLPDSNTVKVANVNKLGSTGSLTITWKNAPLAFTSSPIKRTIPLTWSASPNDWVFTLFPGNGDPMYTISAPYGANISVPNYVRQGYTFAGWYSDVYGNKKYTIPDKMPAEGNRELYGMWTARTDTPYKVEHYLVDPNSGKSTLDATENLQGKTNGLIKITSNKYVAQGWSTSMGSAYINGDGSTVIKLYYNRVSRKMTFRLGYGNPSAEKYLNAEIGKDISNQIPVVSRPGYTFAGWSPSVPNAVPNQDATYTATWTARDDTPYKVVHLLQDISSNAGGADTYTVADIVNEQGTTDTATIAATPKSYEGFTYNGSVPGTLLSGTIAGDGTTVLRLYYKRNAYPVTFDPNGGKISGVATPYVQTVPYGAKIKLPSAANEPYVMDWSPAVPETMPAHALTLTANWRLAKPTANRPGGAVTAGTSVSLSAATPGATIYYTTDGSEPSSAHGTLYGGEIKITAATTIKAIAVKDGIASSDVMVERYTLRVVTLTADVSSGTVPYGTIVKLSSEAGTTIRYTLNGSVPTANSADLNSFTYNAGVPIQLVGDTIIKAAAFKDGEAVSDVLILNYTVADDSQPFSVTKLEYAGEAPGSSGSLLKVTFSSAVDQTTAEDFNNYLVMVESGDMGGMPGMPGMGFTPYTVYAANRGDVGHENEVTLLVDSLTSIDPGTAVSVTVSNVETADKKETIGSGDVNAEFAMPATP